MLCWTAYDINDPECFQWVKDNGRYADVLSDHGVTILASK
ncbi:hypothetical protein GZL_01420 [Streptomyces sp. 769]|nr:hypothetical protein GZL_01420 [Streptomyces sp. 769]